ncbi:collagen alpha-1(I) chain-like [Phaenicophaeus curvirostris]|uniref:collagen alpha-1(I) chain-like n=1 Tax=Phaenicophaeus curvirostris TaxID=33595 RepID=UPI0037F0CCEA
MTTTCPGVAAMGPPCATGPLGARGPQGAMRLQRATGPPLAKGLRGAREPHEPWGFNVPRGHRRPRGHQPECHVPGSWGRGGRRVWAKASGRPGDRSPRRVYPAAAVAGAAPPAPGRG